MHPRDKARGAVTELELCHGRGGCADDTLRLAFEFEADYRDSLRQEQHPPRAADPRYEHRNRR